ncbi:hypothetical protein SVAN01_06544 [Stagonosporopsis vannaccii]|nr:hypothetical protein SVAN01_06544 [Stagonosporopsis vannaccii]
MQVRTNSMKQLQSEAPSLAIIDRHVERLVPRSPVLSMQVFLQRRRTSVVLALQLPTAPEDGVAESLQALLPPPSQLVDNDIFVPDRPVADFVLSTSTPLF